MRGCPARTRRIRSETPLCGDASRLPRADAADSKDLDRASHAAMVAPRGRGGFMVRLRGRRARRGCPARTRRIRVRGDADGREVRLPRADAADSGIKTMIACALAVDPRGRGGFVPPFAVFGAHVGCPARTRRIPGQSGPATLPAGLPRADAADSPIPMPSSAAAVVDPRGRGGFLVAPEQCAGHPG